MRAWRREARVPGFLGAVDDFKYLSSGSRLNKIGATQGESNFQGYNWHTWAGWYGREMMRPPPLPMPLTIIYSCTRCGSIPVQLHRAYSREQNKPIESPECTSGGRFAGVREQGKARVVLSKQVDVQHDNRLVRFPVVCLSACLPVPSACM